MKMDRKQESAVIYMHEPRTSVFIPADMICGVSGGGGGSHSDGKELPLQDSTSIGSMFSWKEVRCPVSL